MVCSKCGNTIEENSNTRFCPNCGNQLSEREPAPQQPAAVHNARPVRSARSGIRSAKAPSGGAGDNGAVYGGAAAEHGFGFQDAQDDPDITRYGTPNSVNSGADPRGGVSPNGGGFGFAADVSDDDVTVYGTPNGVKNGGGRQGGSRQSGGFNAPSGGGNGFSVPADAANEEPTAYGTPNGVNTVNNRRGGDQRQSEAPRQGGGKGFGYAPDPDDADATVYGAPNGGDKAPGGFDPRGSREPFGGPGGGFDPRGGDFGRQNAGGFEIRRDPFGGMDGGYGPRGGGPDDTLFLGPGGGFPPAGPDGDSMQKDNADASNKKFIAIIIPLIAVILAALTVIFIFIVLPEIKDNEDETTTETTASQEEEEKDGDDKEKDEDTTKAEDTADTKDAETTKAAPENVSTTAAPENTTAPLSADGYQPGHYVNSTESRVILRGTTSKNGKVLDRIQQDEFVDVTEVLDLGSSDATVRWWGKVTKNGKTGWVSLYYLTCVDLKGTKVSEAQIRQLWQSLEGYWNTLDKKRFSQCSMNNDAPYFVYGLWYSEPTICAHVDPSGIGDINTLVKLHLTEPASGDPNGYYTEAVSADLYLDLSEMKNGRIAWSFGNGWEDGSYAGKDQSKAMPKT